jgi:hypothetical protein
MASVGPEDNMGVGGVRRIEVTERERPVFGGTEFAAVGPYERLHGTVLARYASRDAWSARLAAAVDRLVAERLLLAEDGDRLATAARESWDVYQEL